ncbi:hypothetical protein [Streptomyces lydicus]|uniref:hypothetical protein n=1 Tax=Streptomyces lydicus TaxID=47763 RepID=UPI003792DE70
MFFPHPVIEQLDDTQVATWDTHFAGAAHERPRAIEEGIWRRTQEQTNADQSGWSEDEHGRRRVVHYRYRYDIDYTFPVPRLVLADLYLYHSVLAPAAEIEAYLKRIAAWLGQGRWRQKGDTTWSKGDLRLTITEHDEHPQDERADRDTPPGFRSVDVVILSDEFEVSRTVRQLPWNVLAGGMRIKETRGEPTIAKDLSELLQHMRVHRSPPPALDRPQSRTLRSHPARARSQRPGPRRVRAVASDLHRPQPNRRRPRTSTASRLMTGLARDLLSRLSANGAKTCPVTDGQG